MIRALNNQITINAKRGTDRILHPAGCACPVVRSLNPVPYICNFMRIGRYIAFLLLLCCVSRMSLAGEDRIAPSFSWISPAEYSILTTNSIRLAVDTHDNEGGSGIESVRFFVEYTDSNGRDILRHSVGELSKYPYELMWDCAHIPDQTIGRLRFFCEVKDRAGNVSSRAEGDNDDPGPMIVVDRNPAANHDMALISRHTRQTFVIDGNLNEWAESDSILFFNNDNRIVLYSRWNRKYLYLAVTATGRSLISHFLPDAESIEGLADEDAMEFYFDVDHDRYEIPHLPDRHFLVAAAGKAIEIASTLGNDSYIKETIANPNVLAAVSHQGSFNDGHDGDEGYTIEFAVLWKELGRKPKNESSLGFEIWNNDKDFVAGKSFYAGWSTSLLSRENPSEWGEIILVDDDMRLSYVIIILVGVAVAGGLFLYLKRKAPAEQASDEETPQIQEKEYILKAREYVKEHYTEEELSREDVGPVVGLTPSYFGKLFKQETGQSFSEYITEVRIEKAKELLVGTRKNISEIALEVGFATQSYFGYCFKKNEEKSPSDYRTEMQKKASSPEIS